MEKESVKIGILRETKIPPVYRVAFRPEQILSIKSNYPDTEIIIQPVFQFAGS